MGQNKPGQSRGHMGGPQRQHSVVKTNFKRDLQQYFNTNNLGDIPFKIASMGSKGKEKYMATVTVEGEQFKTYPQTFNSQAEAEEALAGIIVKKLGILTGSETGGGVVETTDTAVYADRVVDLIGERHNGIWSTQIEKQYQDMFPGEKLPSLWFQEVEALNRIRVDCPIPGSGRYIVFPVQPSQAPPPRQGGSSSPEPRSVTPAPSLSLTQLQPSELRFPEDDLWDVFITFVRSTTHLSVRLIGEEYSEKFEELSSSMDLHYYDKSAIPRVGPRPEVGRIYAAQVSSDWHRVKVVEVRGIDCTCWFLDHGDEDTVPVDDLREIAPKFLELPPQAISVKLAGLEDYEYSEVVVQHLNTFLLGKSLVAKVENRTEVGSCSPSNLKSHTTWPRMVLFDTSSEDVDVNLNQKLIELLLSQDSQSKLPLPGSEEINVFVSYIAPETGDVFVQKESSTFSVVEKVMEEQGAEVMQNQPAECLEPEKLYLAKYSEDGSLYRAVVLDLSQEEMVEVFFVDYGNSAKVLKSEIWEVTTISDSLVAELPRQALRCRLEGVPPAGHSWSPEASAALRERVAEDQVVSLRVVTTRGDIPVVELHLPNSKDGSINFDLSTEFDIFPLAPTEKVDGINESASNGHGNTDIANCVNPSRGQNGDENSPASPLLSPDLACLKTLLAPVIPPEGHYFDISITFAVSPSSFVVQPYNEGTKLELLMTELNSFYNQPNHLQQVTGSQLVEGEYFSARHTDGFWYRVRVTKVIDAEHAAVRYVDYGDLTMVSSSDLQPLWGQFRNLPYQAINARLAGIQPVNGPDWSPEDTVWFNGRVSDKQFVSLVKGIQQVGGEPMLDLVLIDTSHPSEDKFIDQELIQEERAVASPTPS